jgi:hypothetical protein
MNIIDFFLRKKEKKNLKTLSEQSKGNLVNEQIVWNNTKIHKIERKQKERTPKKVKIKVKGKRMGV